MRTEEVLDVLLPHPCGTCGKVIRELWVGEESELVYAWATEDSPPMCVPCSVQRVKSLWQALQPTMVFVQDVLGFELPPVRWGD